MSANDLWIMSIAALVGISCSLVGVFLVLRRLSMLGDAVSHSVLFGIAAAFLLTSSRSTIAMLAGAGAVGLLTAYMTTVLTRHGKLQEDASIGVTFTWLFALGVILISAFAGSIDLDQECVLYGEIAFAPFDRLIVAGRDIGPRPFWILLGVTLANVALLIGGYRRLTLAAFDEALAASLGVSVVFWHYVLMSFVSITTVAAFESVGAILVVAMLVVPANAAYLISRNVRDMLVWAVVFSIVSAIGGYQFAAIYDGSIAASVALMTGVCFLIALLIERLRARSAAELPDADSAHTVPGA